MHKPPKNETPNPSCHACNYSLRGLAQDDPATRCPECGARIADAPPPNSPWRPGNPVQFIILSMTAGFANCVLGFLLIFMALGLGSNEIVYLAFFLVGPGVVGPVFLDGLFDSVLALLFAVAIASALQGAIYFMLLSWARDRHHLFWVLSAIITLHLICAAIGSNIT